ncbi:VOC family protein [Jannaschia sp. Os4]|uniref:VOC family protein n=1 Tax=Jannaschia sp. Os4 TaxID=2807617 RepID=UPI00193A574F|nr:VOC family protein [Jannaschia sp. Os4]MBM2577308.1 VOC family protein [Jannaschia sp. Os4]
MATVTRITPFVLCADLDAGVAFLEGLGFACTFRQADPGYAFLRRDGHGVRLLEADADLDDPARRQMVYVDVDDVDGAWADLRSFVEALPEGTWRAPFDRDYGQREFHVSHGPTLWMFGQANG